MCVMYDELALQMPTPVDKQDDERQRDNVDTGHVRFFVSTL
jgi:hypothetical protein